MSANQKVISLMKTLGLPSTPSVITQFLNLTGGGSNDFTLTVEALAFIDPTEEGEGEKDREVITLGSNQEYLVKTEEGIQTVIYPWQSFPPGEEYSGILPALNIKVDRSSCQDAIQIELVGENISDLSLDVPREFEIPEGESAIMIPLYFSEEAPFGPKIIGVQAIGCGQNKIKALYFEYIDPNAVECPNFVEGYVSVYNNFGTWYDLYFYAQTGGDYEVEFFIDGISAGILYGYVNGNAEPVQVNVSAVWDDNASHQLNITFSPYEMPDLICGDYFNSVNGVGSFSDNFTLMGGIPDGPEEPKEPGEPGGPAEPTP
jgi:hypothetical protein